MATYYNVEVKETEGKLVFTVDLSNEGRESGSGKTTTIATMGKPSQVATTPEGEAVFASLSVFKYPPRK